MFFYLCSMYFHGCGVCRDYNEAYKWFAALCKSSSSLLMYRGLIDEIVGWFQNAAEQGDSIAQKILGDIYYGGKGVPQNYSLAAQFYREAGDQGDMHSQKKLADMYRFGNGVGRDCDEALKWYMKAASQGDIESAAELGDMYYDGEGIPQNYTLAAKWYQMAADQGDEEAKESLEEIRDLLKRR